MKKSLIILRKIVALAVLWLTIVAFVSHIYPIQILDVQLAALIERCLTNISVIAIALFVTILVLTILFGRVYCSTLCPLGIYQEILTIIFKPFSKKRQITHLKHYPIGYALAVMGWGMLIGGTVACLRFVDPYSITGLSLSYTLYGTIFIVVLTVLVFFKKRFFCTSICPVGAVLGLLSRFSLFQVRIDDEKCKMCGVCTKVCPCDSIDFKTNTVNNETCVKCFDCLNHCHHGALYYGLPKEKPVEFNIKRRQLIKSGIVLALFGATVKSGIELSKIIGSKVKKVILPAGAQSVEKFANHCLNCNLCVKQCPQNIIKKATAETPFVHIEYNKNYCKYECHKCSSVCPSGAIKRLSLKEKQHTQIAIAHVDENTCIQCGLCVGECPREIIIKEFGEFPIISEDKCIGCGKCASVCPVHAISMVAVDKQRTLS